MHTSLSRGGNLTGIKAASEQDIAEKQQFSDVKEISINLPSGKDVKLYLDPLGSGTQQKSNAMIYYQPGLNELEVAEAIGSLQFAQAWQDHQTATGGGYNVESGFDVVEKFKADQKQAFGQAAPIIHDLVMDVVRTTGGGESLTPSTCRVRKVFWILGQSC